MAERFFLLLFLFFYFLNLKYFEMMQ